MSFMIRKGRLDLNRGSTRTCSARSGAWLAESALMKRTFRTADISGLMRGGSPAKKRAGARCCSSTDLIYDVLRKHQAITCCSRRARPMPRRPARYQPIE